ncbi:MAG TPA: hypothetical protein VEJ89_05165 [Myxococcaceae bacterium]|jgi:hypothetical protein|nr:hypothetical protein [Myxococcaceae bacterium]
MATSELSHSDQRTLDAVFAHPIPLNLPWRDVVHLLEALGRVEETHGGKLRATINGQTGFVHRSRHKDLTREELVTVRHFLERAGVASARGTAPAAPSGEPPPGAKR